ncbi:NAD-dependent epimerase/dehydratase family protein [Solitalea lacus]|uniref:NAD-dependent epimerase/dehydratase family protein n=1 Tax=Solitalea lacus TaxID=2911172 RepID=UPI001EDB3B73|nr:NAD-dependent epimerase/dehydratase family protein [Solitalea lacus]UKJ08237.1 NAD-dependent epimerase/dehydratase family protein [Solitalea lacus]
MNEIIRQDLEYISNSGIEWGRFKDKTVLISGANGFIPSYLVESLLFVNNLLNQNTRVIALVRNKEKAEKRFRNYLNNHLLEILVQDVCQPIDLNIKVDYIIHAASQASPKYYSIDPVGTLNANIFGTINLLSLAVKSSAQSCLFFSSSEVYGEVEEDFIPIKEDGYGYLNPTSVRSCYAESKRMGETICVSWAHQYGVDVKIVRPFHTYGPMMDLTDGRVFADFVADIVLNRDIIMKSDGTAVRAYCYLSDAIIAYFLVLLKGAQAESYNIGNPQGVCSVIDLANKLVSSFPEKKLKVIRKENMDSNYIPSKANKVIPNIDKVTSLGWKPKVSIEEGFTRTVISYESNLDLTF